MTRRKQYLRAVRRYERLCANAKRAPYPIMRIYSRIDPAWAELQSLRAGKAVQL